jgi:hypothetical protein
MGYGVDLSGSGYRPVAGLGGEPLGSIKCCEISGIAERQTAFRITGVF